MVQTLHGSWSSMTLSSKIWILESCVPKTIDKRTQKEAIVAKGQLHQFQWQKVAE